MAPPTGPPIAPPGGPLGAPPQGPPVGPPGPYGQPQAPYGQPQPPYGQPQAPYGRGAGASYGGYATPVTPGPTNNGLAVAALVLGILTYFCLGPLGAIPAIILGILGLRDARQSGVGRGMSIAGIALGAVGLVVWTLMIVLLIAAGSRASVTLKNLAGPADPSSYQVHGGTCSVDGVGQTTFTGSITNETSSAKSFSIEAEFRDSSSGQVLDDTNTVVSDIKPHSTAPWQITSTNTQTSSGARPTCHVISVDNFFN